MKIKHADVARIASEVRHTQTHPCNVHIEGIIHSVAGDVET